MNGCRNRWIRAVGQHVEIVNIAGRSYRLKACASGKQAVDKPSD